MPRHREVPLRHLRWSLHARKIRVEKINLSPLWSFVANQNPNNCRCFWQKKNYVLKPEQLPKNAVPVEPFIN
ncbi:hypothetical protein APB19_30955 [Pseudomonas aeruginosa]|nr:hypothetical protein APA93_30600 [Pseudomonas aeruginosa]OPE26963.1 hypothetical protein APB19_30955 [Pseudomonas aeruginosa]OUL44435.1 hypothetical protein B2G63_30460 [Pseudomonas aeruginosa]